MPRVDLEEADAARLPMAAGAPTIYWGTHRDHHGLGIFVPGSASGRRTWVVKGLVKVRDGKGNVVRSIARRVVIGDAVGLTALTLKQANHEADAMRLKMEKGIDPIAERKAAKRTGKVQEEQQKAQEERDSLTLRQATADYIADSRAKGRRERTLEFYNFAVNRYLGDWLDKPLVEIDGAAVHDRHRKIAKEIAKRHHKVNQEGPRPDFYSGKSAANGALRTLRAIWNGANKRLLLSKKQPLGPCPVAEHLKGDWFKEKQRESIVEDATLPKLWAALAAHPNQMQADYVRLLMLTGMRREEAAGLRWDTNVKLESRTIRIDGRDTKGGRTLTLPMSDLVFNILSARRAEDPAGEFVFPAVSDSGHIEEPRYILAEVCGETIRTNIGTVPTPHDFRRLFITQARRAGIDTYVRKSLVGHAIPRDITEGYDKLNPDDLRDAMQAITERFKKLCKIAKPKAPGEMPRLDAILFG